MQNTTESNKIIAAFIGFKLYEHFGAFMTESGNVQFYKAKYHKSWDWLMPVIDKIESLGYGTELYCSKRDGYFFSIGKYGSTTALHDSQSESRIECVYNAVVEFITEYNKTKKND